MPALGFGLGVSLLRQLSGQPVQTPSNTYANSTAVYANRDGFSATLLNIQQRIAALGG